MKTVIITQARTGSTRFPNKVMQKTITGDTLLDIHLNRLKSVQLADEIIIATTNNVKDDELYLYLKKSSFNVYRGSEDDVLSRYYECSKLFNAEIVIRVTSDCPLIDPKLIDLMISIFNEGGVDYLNNCANETYPDGQDIEIFNFKSLELAQNKAQKHFEREHVTQYFRNNPDKFRIRNVDYKTNYSNIRMTVDVEDDLKAINQLISKIGVEASWEKYKDCYLSENLALINGKEVRNEGLLKSKKNEISK